MKNNDVKKIENILRALAVGDAFGKICSKYSTRDVIRLYGGKIFNLTKPIRGKSKRKWLEGSITDDTILSLIMANSLVQNRRFCRRDFAIKLINCDPGGGKQIKKLKKSKNPLFVTKTGYTNGSSIRISPLVFFEENIKTLSKNIIDQSTLTHGNKEAITAALCVGYAIYFQLHGYKINFMSFVKKNLKNNFRTGLETKTYKNLIYGFKLEKRGGNLYDNLEKMIGYKKYAWSSVPSAIVIGFIKNATQKDFVELVHRKHKGADLDTVASIAGSIMGARGIDNWVMNSSRKIEHVNKINFHGTARDIFFAKQNKINTIFFDLWDTLIFLPNGWKTFNFLKEEFKIPKSKWVKKIKPLFLCKKQQNIRSFLVEFTSTLGVKIDLEVYRKKMEKQLIRDLKLVKIFPEVKKTIMHIGSQNKIGIISNHCNFYDDLYKSFNFSKYVNYEIFSYKEGDRKPSKKIFGKIKEKKHTLVVGNSLRDDYFGAKRAGINSILVNRGKYILPGKIKQIKKLVELI